MWLVIAVLLVVGVLTYLLQGEDWKTWPTLDQYWEAHPETKSEDGVRCYKCSSAKIANKGFGEAQSRRRIHQCEACSTILYRTE